MPNGEQDVWDMKWSTMITSRRSPELRKPPYVIGTLELGNASQVSGTKGGKNEKKTQTGGSREGYTGEISKGGGRGRMEADS